jgi:hypothetical protein
MIAEHAREALASHLHRRTAAGPDKRPTRAAPGRWAIFLTVVLVAAYFINHGVSWNADTHLYLTASIVDRGSLNIDPFARYTGDISAAGGHFYADKEPGLSLLAVPAYTVIKYTLLRGQPFTAVVAAPPDRRIDYLVRYLLAILLAAIPTGLVAVLLCGVFQRLGTSPGWSAALALTYGLGTIARPFASIFFSHQLSALLCFGAFVLLLRIRHGELSARYALVVGALLGYAAITEIPTIIVSGALLIYALTTPKVGRELASRVALGMSPALALGALYNLLAFGSPLGVGYGHLAGPSEFRVGQAQGFFGVTYPHLDALFATTFGTYRGIFLLSPVLLLAIPGGVLLWRRLQWRAEAVLCAAVGLGYLVFNASYFAWDGGYSLGPRHMLVAVPFMVLPIGELVRRTHDRALAWAHDRRWRYATGLLSGCSIAIVVLSAAVSPFFDQRFSAPLVQWVLPRLAGVPIDYDHPAVAQAHAGAALLHTAPLFLHAQLENNWGQLVGLPGLVQLYPLAIAVAVILLWRAAPTFLPRVIAWRIGRRADRGHFAVQ